MTQLLLRHALDEVWPCFGVGSERRSAPQASDLIDADGVTWGAYSHARALIAGGATLLQIEILNRQTEIGLGDTRRSEIWLMHWIVPKGGEVAEEALHGLTVSDAR